MESKPINIPKISEEEKNLIQNLTFVTASIVIISTDLQGKIRMVNPAVYQVFGYLEGDLIGKNLSFLIPELESKEYDLFEKVTTRGELELLDNPSKSKVDPDAKTNKQKEFNYIERFIYGRLHNKGKEEICTKSKNKNSLWIDLSINRIQSPDLNIYSVIIKDITRLKQSAEDLKRINVQLF